jgi:hypothetical protein
MKHLKDWIIPFVFVFAILLLLSSIISWTKKERENFKNKLEIQKNTPSANNVSLERASKLLPNLKVYLNYQFPERIDLTSNETKEKKETKKDLLNWEDLTENNNDFHWTTLPKKDEKGFHTIGHSLIGPSGKVLSLETTNELTILLRTSSFADNFEKEKEDIKSDDILENAQLSLQGKDMTITIPAEGKELFEEIKSLLSQKKQTNEVTSNIVKDIQKLSVILKKYPFLTNLQSNPVSLKVMGNQKTALEINIPSEYETLQLSVAGKKIPSQYKILPSDDNYYIFIYNSTGDEGQINVYVNTTKIISHKVPKMYFNEKKIIINPSGKWNAGLKEVSMLNRSLHPSELPLFLSQGIILRSLTENYQNKKMVPGLSQPEGCHCSGKCISGTSSYNPYEPHIPLDNKKCSGLCVCKNKNSYDPFQEPFLSDCPPLTKDSEGNYVWNDVSYGKNRRKAKEIYQINNPKCKNIPLELEEWYNKGGKLDKDCPFLVNSPFNPCKFWGCENIDWKEKNPKLNRSCKRRITSYCEEHPYLDNFCSCWRKEFKDKDSCKQFRNQFDDPRNYGIDAGSFDIKEHPDFNKYIRKDKIPCWNCDLT